MTQLQTMSDEKLDFALADQLGWVNAWDGIRLVWLDGKTNEFRRKVTDWHPSTDAADSLEVQAKAIEVDHEGYLLNLMDAVYGGYVAASSERIAGLLTASPRERAEAAYMTLQADR